MNYGASWKGMLTVAVLGTIMVLVARYNVGALKDGTPHSCPPLCPHSRL